MNLASAEAADASLPEDLLASLVSDDDDRGDCTEEEFAAVALRIADRFGAGIRRGDWDGRDRLAGRYWPSWSPPYALASHCLKRQQCGGRGGIPQVRVTRGNPLRR